MTRLSVFDLIAIVCALVMMVLGSALMYGIFMTQEAILLPHALFLVWIRSFLRQRTIDLTLIDDLLCDIALLIGFTLIVVVTVMR